MRTSRFSPEQIIRALREAEAGRPVGELCRQLNVAEATFYRWKKQFGEIGVAELRELRACCGTRTRSSSKWLPI